MPITFGCPSCAKLIRVADSLANKSVRCPHCKAVMTAPDDIPVAPVVAAPPHTPEVVETPPPPPSKPRHLPVTRSPTEAKILWREFGSGCRLVGIGVWCEFAAMFVLLAFFAYLTLSALLRDATAPPSKPPAGLREVLVALGFLPLLVGSVFFAVGRVRMCSVPRYSGAGGLLVTSAVVCVVRCILLVIVGAMLLWLEFGDTDGTPVRFAVPFGLLALMFGWVAELSAFPAAAIVGGVVRSARLRQAAGRMCFALQLWTVAWLVFWFVLSLVRDESPYRFLGDRDRTPVGRRSSVPSTTDDDLIALGVLAVFAVVLVGYTVLHHALYQAGRAAADRPETEE